MRAETRIIPTDAPIPEGGHAIPDSPPPAGRGWLQASPDHLDRFAAKVEVMIAELESLRSRQSDMACFTSPSADPATTQATALLAEDGHYREGTPVYAVSRTIDDLRQQVVAARLAAREYRAEELAVIENLKKAGEHSP